MEKTTIDLKSVLFGEILSACQFYGITISEDDSIISLFGKVVAHWRPEKVEVAMREVNNIKHGLIGELNHVIQTRFEELVSEKRCTCVSSQVAIEG